MQLLLNVLAASGLPNVQQRLLAVQPILIATELRDRRRVPKVNPATVGQHALEVLLDDLLSVGEARLRPQREQKLLVARHYVLVFSKSGIFLSILAATRSSRARRS
jgi:hypothetical protein